MIALVGQRSWLLRATAWVFGGGGALTLLMLVAYGAVYQARLEYRFEVVSLSVTWLALIVSGVLLGIASARARAEAAADDAQKKEAAAAIRSTNHAWTNQR